MRWLALVAVLFVGCSSPTAPDPADYTERQQYIYDYTQCLGDWTGLGKIRVTFKTELDGAAGRASMAAQWVWYHVESVENGPDWYLAALASHEVAHLTGKNESGAIQAENEWPRVCGCGR